MTLAVVAAWLVHLYTASGFVLAFLATSAIVDGDFRSAFLYLWLQVAVDATDGWLARRAKVSERLPGFSGKTLDDLVDFLTYVFVPALAVWRGGIVPDGWATPVGSAMLLSSGFGFSRVKAKTPDHFFIGFPSYWNIVVLYLFVLGMPPWLNALVLLVCGVLVFVPIRYVYPSRTTVLPVLTNTLGAAWAAAVLVFLWRYPEGSKELVLASLMYPIYYVALSLFLQFRRVPAPAA
jgi:phosphatidylcholine synthase